LSEIPSKEELITRFKEEAKKIYDKKIDELRTAFEKEKENIHSELLVIKKEFLNKIKES